jgi:hypothetical protein
MGASMSAASREHLGTLLDVAFSADLYFRNATKADPK